MSIFKWKQPDGDTQAKLQDLVDDGVFTTVVIGKKKYKLKRLRLGALDYIVRLAVVRNIIDEETGKEDKVVLVKRDLYTPYKVAAAGVLNNYWFFDILPFARNVYAWYLSKKYSVSDITPLLDAIMEGAGLPDFFTFTIRLANLVDTLSTVSKKELTKYLQEARSELDKLSSKNMPSSEAT